MRATLEEFIGNLTEVEALANATGPIDELLKRLPSHEPLHQFTTSRKRFDNSAFLISACSALEHYVCELASSYLESISTFVAYHALSSEMQKAHLRASAELLTKQLGGRRYQGLTPQSIVKNLHQCLDGSATYNLNVAALAQLDANPRAEPIAQLFGSLDIENINTRLVRTDPYQEWLRETGAPSGDDGTAAHAQSIARRLNQLVDARNHVAHRGRTLTDLHGASEMLEQLRFLRAYARGVFAVVAAEYLSVRYVKPNRAILLSQVETPKRDGRVVIVAPSDTELKVGQPAFVQGRGCVCRWGRIRELRINDIPQSVVPGGGTDPVGVAVDFRCPHNAGVHVLAENDDALWPSESPGSR